MTFRFRAKEWPLEDVELLKTLWAQGMSARQISREFFAKGKNYSRNSIIGKVNRINLPQRESVVRKISTPRPTPKPKPEKPPAPTEPLPMAEPETFAGRNECQYIYGDPAEPNWQMCGHPVVEGKRWCAWHLARCVVPNEKKTA